jgi:hypothetical protein
MLNLEYQNKHRAHYERTGLKTEHQSLSVNS